MCNTSKNGCSRDLSFQHKVQQWFCTRLGIVTSSEQPYETGDEHFKPKLDLVHSRVVLAISFCAKKAVIDPRNPATVAVTSLSFLGQTAPYLTVATA